MRKIIIASHHNFANGLNDTVEYIVPNQTEIITIAAYTTNEPVQSAVAGALSSLSSEDEAIVFTDLLGGSVNQEFVKYIAKDNVHIITGMNLPVVLGVLMGLTESKIDPDFLRATVSDAKEQLVYVNDYFSQQTLDEDDE